MSAAKSVLTCILLSILLGACHAQSTSDTASSTSEETDTSSPPRAEKATDMPQESTRPETLSLQLLRRVYKNGKDQPFGDVTDLVPTPSGEVYASDGMHSDVYRITSDSTRRVGASWALPPSFPKVTSMSLGRDTLYAFSLARHEVHAIPLNPSDSGVRSVQLPNLPSLHEARGIPVALHATQSGRFLVHYTEPRRPTSPEPPLQDRLGWTNAVGHPLDTTGISLQKQQEFPVSYATDAGFGDFTHYSFYPFLRHSSHAILQDGRVAFGWTNSLSIEVRSFDASAPERFRLDTSKRPVTAAQKERFRRTIRAASVVPGAEPVHRPSFPDFWPAFYDVLADDRNRLWIQVDTASREGRTTWWIYDLSTGDVTDVVSIPMDVSLHAVVGTRAYGVHHLGSHGDSQDVIVLFSLQPVP